MTSSSSTQQGPKRNIQFYRRPLPPTCIDFTSEEGRAIFKEAMNSGYMTCFFKLSSQFRTQDEPAYCGLTSLVMALNVLEIDPGRVWKGPWRWYHEDMLDCCISLDKVKQKGVHMEQFICIAKCNNLSVELASVTQFKSLDDLRVFIKEKTQIDHQVVIASYSREAVGQAGNGHFSPIAGYHEGTDTVLILDTARFKYPPHWLPLSGLLTAMNTPDTETGHPRGLVILSRVNDYVGTLLYRPSCSLLISNEKGTISSNIWHFSVAWNSWLDGKLDQDNSIQQPMKLMQDFVRILLDSLHDTQLLCLVTQSKAQGQCESVCCQINCKNVSPEEEEGIRTLYFGLITELESLKTYDIVKEILSTVSKEDRLQIMKLVACSDFYRSEEMETVNETKNAVGETCNSQTCSKHKGYFSNPKYSGKEWSVSIKITPENILTVLFLMWPVNKRGDELVGGSRREWMTNWLREDLKGIAKVTIRQEVFSLNVKVVEVLNYHSNDPRNTFVPISAFT